MLDIITLENGDSYHFLTQQRGRFGGGDLYFFTEDAIPGFWANNVGQRGIQSLGDLGDTPLNEVSIPESGYTEFGVKAVRGHTYVSLAREGEEGHFIVFRVLDLVPGERVTLEYLYTPTPTSPPMTTPSTAPNITVTSNLDATDANPGDGICDDGAGGCTLRAAVMEANAFPGRDTITLPTGAYTLSIAELGEDSSRTGDLDITDDLTIVGAGGDSTIIDSGRLDRVLQVHVGVTVNISGVAIQNGDNVAGGGIMNSGTLTLTNSTVRGNSSSKGGGIANIHVGSPPRDAPPATLTLINSTVDGNSAEIGGGIFNDGVLNLTDSTISNNKAVDLGGGIATATQRDDPITLTNSVVNGNSARIGGGIASQVPLFLNGSTVSGNTARDPGGGIWTNSSITLNNSTVSSNTAGGTGGGINNLGTVTLTNTIIASNLSGDDCFGGGFTSLGHNLDSDSTCNLTEPTDLPGVDPLLGPLHDNGGPTETHALLPDSPAINAADDAACPDTDQRGVSRPQGAACDIGAYER